MKGSNLLGWDLQLSRPWDYYSCLAWGKREDPEGGPHPQILRTVLSNLVQKGMRCSLWKE